MMLPFFLVLVLAVGAFGDADYKHDDEECCSAEDRREIQYIWKRVWAHSFTDRKVAIARAIFEDIFDHQSDAKKLFTRVHVDQPDSGEFRAHLVRVANGLDNLINLLSSPAVLVEQLKHLAHQHEARQGVTKAHFEAMGSAFARVLPQVSSCFNVEAWNRCFYRLAKKVSANLP